MLASTYNGSALLSTDYGPLEQLGELDSRVYRGRGNDGRYVALRFSTLHAEASRTELIEAAQAASFIQHPMLAAVGGCQSFSGGTLCIVSEYVPGRTLDRWLAENGPPSLQIAIDFVRRLCLGAYAAQQRGLIHPALRPSNLTVLQPDTQPDGRIVAKLLDLGAPSWLHAWPPRPRDVPFVAPELRNALEPHATPVTPAMNVYSCGVLLHYLCTGEAPLLASVDTALPDELQTLLANALCADPGERTQTTAELAAALGQLETTFRNSGVYRSAAAPAPASRVAESRSPATRSSQSLPRVSVVGGRGLASVPPPPTGTFPRITIPASQRWVGVGALAGLLGLYAAWVLWTTSAPRAGTTPAERLATRTTSPAAPQPPAAPKQQRSTPAPKVAMNAKAAPAAAEAEPEPTARPVDPPQPPPLARPRRVKPRGPQFAAPAGLADLPTPTAPIHAEEPRPSPLPEVVVPASEPVRAERDAQPAPVPIVTPESLAVDAESAEPAQQTATTRGRELREPQVVDMNVRGSLAVSVVRRAMARIRPLLAQCYELHVPPGKPSPAPLLVSATIDEVGRVRNPSVEGGSLPALSACVVKATSKMVAEAPDTGTVRVSWSLRF